MRLRIILAFVFVSTTVATQAQWLLGFHGLLNQPLKELHQNGYRHGWGGAMEFNTPSLIRNSNEMGLRFGAQIDFSVNGRVKSNIELMTPNSDPGKLAFRNSSLYYGLFMRYSPVSLYHGTIFPYLDFIASGRLLETVQVISADKNIPDYEKETVSKVLDTRVFSPGIALGAAWSLNDFLFLDTKVGYDQGNQISFINLHNVRQVGNNYAYTASTAKNSMLWFKVGILVKLIDCEESPDHTDYHRTDIPKMSVPSAPKKVLTPKPVTPKPVEN